MLYSCVYILQAKYDECSKIVHQQAFAKAISYDEHKTPISEAINLDSISKLYMYVQ